MITDKPIASMPESMDVATPICRLITRAEIIDCFPPQLRLYGPLFKESPSGSITMPLVRIQGFRYFRDAVLSQALALPPSHWATPHVWDRIARRIVARAERLSISQRGGRHHGNN